MYIKLFGVDFLEHPSTRRWPLSLFVVRFYPRPGHLGGTWSFLWWNVGGNSMCFLIWTIHALNLHPTQDYYMFIRLWCTTVIGWGVGSDQTYAVADSALCVLFPRQFSPVPGSSQFLRGLDPGWVFSPSQRRKSHGFSRTRSSLKRTCRQSK